MSQSKYPTTMNCREAFDQLTICYSIEGKFRNCYRYGQFNPCQRQLTKLNFCLLHGTDPIKVQEWYKAELESNKELKGSSDTLQKERS